MSRGQAGSRVRVVRPDGSTSVETHRADVDHDRQFIAHMTRYPDTCRIPWDGEACSHGFRLEQAARAASES